MNNNSLWRSWPHHITLDLLLKVAGYTIFHPFVMWMVPLSLKAQATPSSHPSFQLSVAYASFLTILSTLLVFNQRIAYGAPREVKIEDEVVLVTGGASGLGRLIADFYVMRGASVAVLDIKQIDDEASGISSFLCDIRDAGQIESTAEKIIKELGAPTILVNNAAVLFGKPILELSAENVETSFRVNLLSHFHTIRTFLPAMIQNGRGTIVTVASVLGHLGCANLSDYTAAKAGLMAMHASLRAELAWSKDPSARKIQTILVAPGQLASPMFEGMKTPSNFLAPVVEPVDLAREIVKMIDSGWSGEVSLPFYARWVQFIAVLPVSLQRFVRYLSGLDRAMLDFSTVKGKRR